MRHLNRRQWFGSVGGVWVASSLGRARAGAPSAAAAAADPPPAQETLLLRDFKPKSMLHTKVTQVPRARFPVIDVHNHVNDARSSAREQIPPAEVLRIMDAANIHQIVILTGAWGERLQSVVDRMVKPYPDRFRVFTQIDWSKIDDPDFSRKMVEQLDDAVERGARGLKVLKKLGLGVRDKTGKLVAVDDPRLDPIWEECGRLGIPVSIHVSDPEAFFLPVDGSNERYEELIHNPDWSFYGSQFPTKQAILDARDRMFARHPHTTFTALHVGNWPENLDYVSALLDRLPNVMVEFGAREAELGRQPRRARKFFLDYQDRIMFGTDMTPSEGLYRNYFRWLETDDEYFDYWGHPEQGRWEIYGLGLPDEVLKKVYHLNAQRIFSQFKGASG
jgi:predicted TIM-barrel fold metal-dependent hydrolase